MEEKEIKEVKKEKNGQMVIIVIMGLIIIGLIGVICYDKGIIFESEKKEVSEKTESKGDKEEVEKEVEISDKLLIKDLSEKIVYLNTQRVYKDYDGFTDSKNESNSINLYYFRNNVYTNNITDDIKLDIVLNSLLNSFENLSIAYENMDAASQEYFKPYVEIGRVNDIAEMQISAVKVEERYLSLFGEKLTNHRNIGSCPVFVYDTKNSVYYYTRVCGGTSGGDIYLYKNKFTTKGNNAYVYVNIGFTDDYNNVYDGYNDNSTENNNAKVVENYTESFSINESNHTKYSEYKYTFNKNADGNYYFVSVEKNN